MTFTGSFSLSDKRDYLIVADLQSPPHGTSAYITLENNAFSALGDTTGAAPVVQSVVTPAEHIRSAGGGGSIGAQTLSTTPVTGGGTDGGGAVGEDDDGESLTLMPGHRAPSSTGAVDDAWR